MVKKRLANFMNFIIITSLSFLCSCKEIQDSIFHIKGYDDAIYQNGENIKIKNFDAIALDVPDSIYIGTIRQIGFSDSLIVVLGYNMIYTFNYQGAYCGHIGNIGHGHGEYIQPKTFCINNKQNIIEVIDTYANSILQFDLNGKFLSSKKVKQDISAIYQYEYLPDGKILGCNYIFKKPSDVYFIGDADFANITHKLSSNLISSAMMPVGSHPFTVRDQTIKMCLPFSNIIYEYVYGEIKPFMQIDSKLKVFDEKEIKNINFMQPVNMSTVPSKQDIFWGFSDLFETDKFIILNTPYDSYFIIEKGKLMGKRYSNYSFEQMVYTHLPLIKLNSAKGDTLVGIDNAKSLKNRVILDSLSQDHNMIKFRNFINSLPDKDIPVLLMYQIESI